MKVLRDHEGIRVKNAFSRMAVLLSTTELLTLALAVWRSMFAGIGPVHGGCGVAKLHNLPVAIA